MYFSSMLDLDFKRIILFISLILGAFFSPQAKAEGETLKLSFSDALRMARERQIQSIVAEERVLQALQRIRQAKSSLYPQLMGTAYQYRRVFNLESIGIDLPLPDFNPLVGPFNTFDARVSLTQVLFDATVLSRLKTARLGGRLSQSELAKARLDAMALVANLFIEARRAQERVPLIRTVLKLDEALLQLSRGRKSLGLGSELEISQAQASWELARSQLSSAKTDALERRLDLAAALGLPQNRPIDFILEEDIGKMPLPEASDFKSLVTAHPEVESAHRKLEQVRQERKTEVAEFYPKLTGNADYGANGKHPGNSDDTYNFGGQLTIPIFQGGLRKARIREAQSRVEESEAQWEDTLRQQEAKSTKALANLKQSLKFWKAKKTDLSVARRELSLARSQLHSGLGSRLQVIQAEAKRADVQDQKEEAVATFYQARVNLGHATGTLAKWIPGGE
jgi:outer membrane protein